METEIFKFYKKTGGYKAPVKIYEVSNLGRVRVNGDLIEPYLNGKYLSAGSFMIHRAVAELFIPNPENKPQVDHINANKFDNRAENLRWVTAKENCNNPNFIIAMRNANIGEKNPMYGKHISYMSEEVRKRVGEKNKINLTGRKLSAKHKENISKGLYEHYRKKEEINPPY